LHTADERDERVQGPFPIGEGAGIDLGDRLRGEKNEIPVGRFVGGVLRADVPASTRLVLEMMMRPSRLAMCSAISLA
jgi:hypothetical protein